VRRLFALLALVLAGCGTAAAMEGGGDGTTTTVAGRKVFVCKYEGTPGVDERLQTGNNPISVDYKSGREPGGFFNDAQGRSYVLEYDTGQDEPGVSECPPPDNGGGSTTTTQKATTTTQKATTTTEKATTTTSAGTTTTTAGGSTTTSTSVPGGTTTTSRPPTGQFSFPAVSSQCTSTGNAIISITFPVRTDLAGQTGTLTFTPGGSVPLTFLSGASVTVPYPAGVTTSVSLSYTVGGETATAGPVSFPTGCAAVTTTTSPGATTTIGATTTTSPGATTTTRPATPSQFSFGAAATVCVREVPTIRIVFQNTFPELAGQAGTLTMADVNGNVVSTQSLVYRPGTTVDLLYPGTRVNADGTIADVPGWNLNSAGFWVRDSSDAFLREGINLRYEVNPTAQAFVSYPPESANCANPDGPFPPTVSNPPAPGVPFSPTPTPTPASPGTPSGGLPPTL
jgi:hypothetical protein